MSLNVLAMVLATARMIYTALVAIYLNAHKYIPIAFINVFIYCLEPESLLRNLLMHWIRQWCDISTSTYF